MSYYDNNNNHNSGYNAGYNNHNSTDSHYNQNNSNDYYNQHPQQYGQAQHTYSENVVPPTDHMPENGERGLLGAAGGAIGGGILGKQTGHGFLGTVGGALVGSLGEDFVKKLSRPSSPAHGATATATATATAGAISHGHGGHSPMTSPPVYHHVQSPGYGTSTATTTTATSYFQPPCVNTAHPCQGGVHHCVPAQHGHGHGSHSWGTWHK